MRRLAWTTACLAMLCAPGCGGRENYGLAPVSGTVMMDGKPLPEARVMFFPELSGESQNPGPPSTGITDETGRFTLACIRGGEGAVIGPHRVTITTQQTDENDRIIKRETVPDRYNSRSELKFDVSREGTDKADFALQSNSR